MRRIFGLRVLAWMAYMAYLAGALVADEAAFTLCEWKRGGATIRDPCPEFWWPPKPQKAYRVLVATDRKLLVPQRADLWDSGWREDELNIAEYAGKRLQAGQKIFWRILVRRRDGSLWQSQPDSVVYKPRELPRRLPHIRTYLNFGSKPEVIAKRYDLTYRREAKQYNPRIITVNYSLIATCVIPSERAKMLAEWCVQRGLTRQGIAEEMFLHFARDTKVTLHQGAERADRPRVTRIVPGWDPRNDRNGDGVVDDREAANLVNPKATARRPKQARIPIYFWPPPRADYVLNIGNPEYQAFMAERYMPSRLKGFDAIYTDTTPPHIPARWGSDVLEYPDPGSDAAWLRDMQRLMAEIKRRLPDTLWFANGWHAMPFVIDGTLRENWLNIGHQLSQVKQAIDDVRAIDARGKIQLVQYNPVYDPKENEFGVKVPVDKNRDRIYGLAAYYLASGDYTYFAIGQHPYVRSEDKWFPAIETDIGKPLGPPFVFYRFDVSQTKAKNLLTNGDFEADEDGDGNPDGWQAAEPVELVTDVLHSGRRAVRIRSTTAAINNINRQYVTLKPNTTYTLVAWIRTEGVVGSPGAQVYPYEFDDAQGRGMITVQGTTPWRQYWLAFTTGQDVKGRINFRMFGAVGTAWFDDIALYEGLLAPWEVLARKFEKALVLLRPPVGGYSDSTARQFSLNATYRPLRMDGTLGPPSNTVTLRSGEAAILLRERS